MDSKFDVIVCGAGFGGVAQTRHLLLKNPGMKIAIIDTMDETERENGKWKVGESMIEIATMFVNYELELYEYMIDNHPPKFGLSYHWPKNSAKTDQLDDYFHVWANRSPQVQSYHLKRAKFEADVLKMNKEMGATFIKGKVTGIDITEGSQDNSVTVRVDGEERELTAPYVVDAAGRSHLLGRKFDNIKWDPEIQTGAYWVRVTGVDRDMFLKQTKQYSMTSSPLYSTNHWFGPGYWCWQIPICKKTNTMSIGVVHHKNIIPSEQLNTKEKFLAFMKANQTIVYDLINSGEILDSTYWSKLAFESKQLMSTDGWMVLGDAAAFYDPFYSIGTTMVALQVETFTNAILSKDRDTVASKLIAFNQFNLNKQQVFRKVVQHFDHVASAGAMSARIFFDFIGYFGFTLPMYIGKWHLSRKYCELVTRMAPMWVDFMDEVYTQLDIIAQRGINIGLMDYSHANELLWSSYSPSDMAGHFLEDGQLFNRRLDVMHNNQQTASYLIQWYLRVMWKAYGVSGVLAPSTLLLVSKLSAVFAASNALSWWHWYSYLGAPDNAAEGKMHKELEEHPGEQVISLQQW